MHLCASSEATFGLGLKFLYLAASLCLSHASRRANDDFGAWAAKLTQDKTNTNTSKRNHPSVTVFATQTTTAFLVLKKLSADNTTQIA
jgi:hypothetical protein